MKFLRIYFLLIVVSGFITAHAQDFTFSQIAETPVLRNPALAGIFKGDMRVTMALKNQWQSFTVPYQTKTAGVEIKFPFCNSQNWLTGGLQVTQDAAGDIQLKRTQVHPVINFHKILDQNSNTFLSLAAMFGPTQSQFDPNLLKMGDQFDNQTGSYNPNIISQQTFSKTGTTYWDFSTGIALSSSYNTVTNFDINWYLGMGLFHVFEPNVSVIDNGFGSKLNRKYTINAGINMAISDYEELNFIGDYFMQAGNKQFSGGLLYKRNLLHDIVNDNTFNDIAISFGAFYRWNDALIPIIKTEWHALSVGLSYDCTVSKLKTSSQTSTGAYELTLMYRCNFKNRRCGYENRSMPCPKF